ncbi:MAG: hypothetical protein JNJ46_17940 [Myxococcales bacterium]|nr:hypothetical protein [Myxococcales bacterium]
MTKERDLEWRLVATKGRESCRWQTADNSAWIALSLGASGDITKVVVTASDGRSEIVDGYELGLNVARRWRNDWKAGEAPRSSNSGPWLPPLPGRAPESYGEDPTPPSYPPDGLPPRSTVPSPSEGARASTPLSPTARTRPSVPPDSSLISSHPARPGDSPQSRATQSIPPGKPVSGSAPASPATGSHSSDDRGDSRDRSWPPRSSTPPAAGPGSTRSVTRSPQEAASESGSEHSPRPGKPKT